MKKFAVLLIMSLLFLSCNNDDSSGDVVTDDDETTMLNATLAFSQNFDGITVTSDDFGITEFTTDFGDVINITRLRYLLSRIELRNQAGEVFSFTAYQLIDIVNPTTNTVTPAIEIPSGVYTISFVYGFNEEDNVDAAYSDLNALNFNWPEDLGGGYHFMQFDGNYDVDTGDPKPFNYHNGTARVSKGVFEQNFVAFDIPQTVAITNDVKITIAMNIAEWFRDPFIWDLSMFDVNLMPNYEAQKNMNRNAGSVFSVSTGAPD